jgi:hypothetical protein
MARFTTRFSGNPPDSLSIYAHRRHTVYCVSRAVWRSPRVHSLHTTGMRQCLRHFTVYSTSSITGIQLDGQAASRI